MFYLLVLPGLRHRPSHLTKGRGTLLTRRAGMTMHKAPLARRQTISRRLRARGWHVPDVRRRSRQLGRQCGRTMPEPNGKYVQHSPNLRSCILKHERMSDRNNLCDFLDAWQRVLESVNPYTTRNGSLQTVCSALKPIERWSLKRFGIFVPDNANHISELQPFFANVQDRLSYEEEHIKRSELIAHTLMLLRQVCHAGGSSGVEEALDKFQTDSKGLADVLGQQWLKLRLARRKVKAWGKSLQIRLTDYRRGNW